MKILRILLLRAQLQRGSTGTFQLAIPSWSMTHCHVNNFPLPSGLLPHRRKLSVSTCGSSGPICSNAFFIKSSNPCRTIETDANNTREKQGRRKSRRTLDIEDVWLTSDQWKDMKASWISGKQEVIKMYVPRTPFEFELDVLHTVATKNLSNAGSSLVAYLQGADIPLNYQVVGKCLHMCLSCMDLEGIIWCVEWLKKSECIMDKGTIANVISGLCLTDRWQESLQFLSRAEEIDSVTPRILEPFFIAACKHGDRDRAKDLLEYHYRKDIMPSEATCLQLLTTFTCDSKDDQVREENWEIVRRLLAHMREKRHYPLQSVAEKLGLWFRSAPNEKWQVHHTCVTHSGVCKACKAQLESLHLEHAVFDNLRSEIFTKVIQGPDIFKKTTPQELDAFMEFVDGGQEYDIVIDGLNLANIKKRVPSGQVLRQFVVYLSQECGYRCLVLGRHHMLKQHNKYSKQDMEIIQNMADCFFTQDMSEDDPFMLYATLHSGTKARYITRDMLRDHKALLSPSAHLAFIKWQRSQQMIPVDFKAGKAIFQKPLAHDTVIQSTENSWHIPYDDGQPRFSYQVPQTWLCASQH